jgi:excisionase family DNA binding protein
MSDTRLIDLPCLPGRLALTPDQAAEALGVSRDFFDKHVIHELRVVRRGRRRIIPVASLVNWLDAHAALPLEADG